MSGPAGYQPRTQSANPRLPDGRVPVSGVVDPATEPWGWWRKVRAQMAQCVADAVDRKVLDREPLPSEG